MAKIEYMQSTFCSDLKPRARLVLQCLILHSNKEWVPTKYVYQYTIPFVILELVIVLVIGVPLANLLM